MSRMIDDEETLKDNGLIEIDGVNVADCEHLWKDNSVIDLNFCRINFDNNYFSNGIPCCDKCNKHPDCYFKQLQRAKAKNEKLKAEKDEYYQNNLTYERQISELIQVLEYIRDLNNKTVQIPIITDKINEVLNEG